jgi:hypothetical protein
MHRIERANCVRRMANSLNDVGCAWSSDGVPQFAQKYALDECTAQCDTEHLTSGAEQIRNWSSGPQRLAFRKDDALHNVLTASRDGNVSTVDARYQRNESASDQRGASKTGWYDIEPKVKRVGIVIPQNNQYTRTQSH